MITIDLFVYQINSVGMEELKKDCNQYLNYYDSIILLFRFLIPQIKFIVLGATKENVYFTFQK